MSKIYFYREKQLKLWFLWIYTIGFIEDLITVQLFQYIFLIIVVFLCSVISFGRKICFVFDSWNVES